MIIYYTYIALTVHYGNLEHHALFKSLFGLGKHRTSDTANNTKRDIKYLQTWNTKTFYCTSMLAPTFEI